MYTDIASQLYMPTLLFQGLSGVGGDLLCRFWLTRWPLWSVLMSSTYNLLVLTLNMYWQIVHPIAHKIHFSQMKLNASLVFVWLIGPLYNLAFKMPTTFVIHGECVTITTLHRVFSNSFMNWQNKTAGCFNNPIYCRNSNNSCDMY